MLTPFCAIGFRMMGHGKTCFAALRLIKALSIAHLFCPLTTNWHCQPKSRNIWRGVCIGPRQRLWARGFCPTFRTRVSLLQCRDLRRIRHDDYNLFVSIDYKSSNKVLIRRVFIERFSFSPKTFCLPFHSPILYHPFQWFFYLQL